MEQTAPTVLRFLLLASRVPAWKLARHMGVSEASLSRTAQGVDEGKTLDKCAKMFGLSREVLLAPVSADEIVRIVQNRAKA